MRGRPSKFYRKLYAERRQKQLDSVALRHAHAQQKFEQQRQHEQQHDAEHAIGKLERACDVVLAAIALVVSIAVFVVLGLFHDKSDRNP